MTIAICKAERRLRKAPVNSRGQASPPGTSKGVHDEVLPDDGRRSLPGTARVFGGGEGAESDRIGGASEATPLDPVRRKPGGLRRSDEVLRRLDQQPDRHRRVLGSTTRVRDSALRRARRRLRGVGAEDTGSGSGLEPDRARGGRWPPLERSVLERRLARP